jgi:hypothetical protein
MGMASPKRRNGFSCEKGKEVKSIIISIVNVTE